MRYNAFATEYRDILTSLVYQPDFVCTPRGLNCHELTPGEMWVDPLSCFFHNEKRDFQKLVRYLIGETLWYFGGRNDLEFISRYASFWKNIANPDGTCNSAYGNLLFTMKDAHSYYQISGKSQWEWAYDSLKNDKDTRQAIMHFNRPCHQYEGNRDFPCTCYVNFLIRDGRLNMISRMRSQDVIKGLTYDLPFFAMLHQNMFLLLLKVYPGLSRGCLLHTSDSMHFYDTDLELVKDMLTVPFNIVDIHLPKPLVDEHGKTTEFYAELLKHAETAYENPNAAMFAFKMLGGHS